MAVETMESLTRSGLVRKGVSQLRIPDVVPTRIPGVDGLLPGGGLPCGYMTELSGGASSGKLTIATRALAAVLRDGERAALVDMGGRFFPALSPAFTRALQRLLVCRVATLADGIASAELLVGSGGMALVVVDLIAAGAGLNDAARSALARLERVTRAAQTAVLLVTESRFGGEGVLGSSVALRLEATAERRRVSTGRIESVVRVARNRFGPPGARAATG
jgi:hypothetical protein